MPKHESHTSKPNLAAKAKSKHSKLCNIDSNIQNWI